MDWTTLLGYVVIGLLCVGTPAVFIAYYRYMKAKRKQGLDAMAESDTLPEPELVWVQVTETNIHRYYTGSRKLPIYNEEYLVKFQPTDGAEIVCTVPKEVYYAISEGDSGMLLHVNGNFLDFGEGKECDTIM